MPRERRSYELFDLLGDLYLVARDGTISTSPLSDARLRRLLGGGLPLKRIISAAEVTSQTSKECVSTKVPIEYAVSTYYRRLIGAEDELLHECRFPTGGLVVAAADILSQRPEESEVRFEMGADRVNSVKRAGEGLLELLIPEVEAVNRDLYLNGERTYGPIRITLDDGSALAYLVDAGDPYMVIFAGYDAPQDHNRNDELQFTIRHFWSESYLTQNQSLLTGPVGAEPVRREVLWRLGRGFDASPLDIPDVVSLVIAGVDAAAGEIRYRVFDGPSGGPVNASIGASIASVIGASDLGMLDRHQSVVMLSATSEAKLLQDVNAGRLFLHFDGEAWHATTACESVLGDSP